MCAEQETLDHTSTFHEADLEHRSRLRELRRSAAALRQVIVNPEEQAALFTIFRNFPVFDVMRHITLRLPIMGDPRFRRLYDARAIPDFTEAGVDRLLTYGPETLGGAFGRYVRSKNLGDAHLTYLLPPDNPSRYLIYRTAMLHDMLHFVTGYSASEVIGEMEVDAFQLAQTGAPNHVLFLCGGLGNVLLSQEHLPTAITRRVRRAWQRGARAQNLFLADWDAHLGAPKEAVIRSLGL